MFWGKRFRMKHRLDIITVNNISYVVCPFCGERIYIEVCVGDETDWSGTCQKCETEIDGDKNGVWGICVGNELVKQQGD